MRMLKLAAVVALAVVFGGPVNSQDLPYDVKTATCDEIIAHTDDNTLTKMVAASLYAGGQHMGVRCIKADYVRAFELWAEIGHRRSMKSAVHDLLQRANAGNAAAASHLRKLEAAGFIDEFGAPRNR